MEDYARILHDRDREQDQMGRHHILMVNRAPALLDFVRVILDDARFNVTTTNAVPLTFALIATAQPSLLIMDLEITEVSGWDLLVRLHTEARTARIPVIITAKDDRLLAHAHRYPHLYGGQVKLVVPFSAEALLDSVHSLVGTA